MRKKTVAVTVRLPLTVAISIAEIAKIAGVDPQTVVSVILALAVFKEETK